MNRHISNTVVFPMVLAFAFTAASSARAGYQSAGYDLQVVQSAQGLRNTAVSYLTNPTWSLGASGVTKEITTTFTAMPSCQSISFARLYLDVWGGSNYKTSTVDATLNGVALPTVSIGGTSDGNPTFDAAKTCVYGAGAGMWQVAYADVENLLKKDGASNILKFTVTNTTEDSIFDGRTACASLVSVYTDPTINQTLDYYLAEADGTLRSSPTNSYGSPSTRSLVLNDINTDDVNSAFYYAGYTHGTTGENDTFSFNNTSFGGSNVAIGTTSDYGPNNIACDISSCLLSSSTATYTATGESYLRANIGLLAVTRPVPEPAGAILLATGLATLLLLRWRGNRPTDTTCN